MRHNSAYQKDHVKSNVFAHRHRDQTWVAKGEGGKGEGWSGNWGLVGANYYM